MILSFADSVACILREQRELRNTCIPHLLSNINRCCQKLELTGRLALSYL